MLALQQNTSLDVPPGPSYRTPSRDLWTITSSSPTEGTNRLRLPSKRDAPAQTALRLGTDASYRMFSANVGTSRAPSERREPTRTAPTGPSSWRRTKGPRFSGTLSSYGLFLLVSVGFHLVVKLGLRLTKTNHRQSLNSALFFWTTFTDARSFYFLSFFHSPGLYLRMSVHSEIRNLVIVCLEPKWTLIHFNISLIEALRVFSGFFDCSASKTFLLKCCF